MEDSDAVKFVIWELARLGGVIEQVFARADRALHGAQVADRGLNQSQCGRRIGRSVDCRGGSDRGPGRPRRRHGGGGAGAAIGQVDRDLVVRGSVRRRRHQ